LWSSCGVAASLSRTAVLSASFAISIVAVI
jgi:hypothetical protein